MLDQSFAILPWQQNDWTKLQAQRQRLAHALLFYGLPGIGKRHFANCFAASLLCYSPDAKDEACGHCKSCQLMMAGHHPDFLCLTLDVDSQVIKIDSIRRLVTFSLSSAHYHHGKVAIIQQADKMNVAASNALLKTLEEPASDIHIILMSDQLSSLLPTLRSRCQIIRFARTDAAVAKDYLQQQGIKNGDELLALVDGAPLQAKMLAKSQCFQQRQQLFESWYRFISSGHQLLMTSKQWSTLELCDSLNCLQSWLSDSIRLKLAPGCVIANQVFAHQLQQLATDHSVEKLFACLEQLQAKHKLLMTNIAFNKTLFVESMLLLCWQYLSDNEER